MKKQYTSPATSILRIKMRSSMLQSVSGMKIYKNEEANADDVQYSRRGHSIWDDEE